MNEFLSHPGFTTTIFDPRPPPVNNSFKKWKSKQISAYFNNLYLTRGGANNANPLNPNKINNRTKYRILNLRFR